MKHTQALRLSGCVASLLLVAGGLAAADLDTVSIHGFISQGYVRTSDNGYYDPDTSDGGSLEFREIGLTVLAQPEERLRIGIQLLSQDMGNIYNNEVVIDWASAVYTLPMGDWEGDFKVGRIKTGHALYNDYRDLDFSRTTVFLPECVYFNSWRRLYVALDGLGAALRSPDLAAGRVEFNAVYGTQQVDPDDPVMSGYAGQAASTEFERQWALQLAWFPVTDLQLKLSLMAIDQWETVGTAGADELISDVSPFYYEYVASLEWTHGPFQLACEGIFWDSEGTSVYDDTSGSGGTVTSDWSQTGLGGYVSASYELAQGWRVAALAQAHNMRYTDEYWGDSSDQTRAYGIATSYTITDHWLVKAEFDYVDGTYFLRWEDQPDVNAADYESDEWTMLALRTTFDF